MCGICATCRLRELSGSGAPGGTCSECGSMGRSASLSRRSVASPKPRRLSDRRPPGSHTSRPACCARLRLSLRPANDNRTYGYHRAGILAAFVNSAALVGISEYFRYQGALGRVTLTALTFQVVIGGMIVIAVVAWLTSLLILGLEKFLCPWRRGIGGL